MLPTQLPGSFKYRATESDDGHWLWHGATTDSGRPNYCYNGKNVLAHRAAYMIMIGPLEGRERLVKTCLVDGCVNPYHYNKPEKVVFAPIKKRPAKCCSRGHEYVEGSYWVWNQSGGASGQRRQCKECTRMNRLTNTTHDNTNTQDLSQPNVTQSRATKQSAIQVEDN